MKCFQIHVNQTSIAQNKSTIGHTCNGRHGSDELLVDLFHICLVSNVCLLVGYICTLSHMALNPHAVNDWVSTAKYNMLSTVSDHEISK
jgi:hypothetical protein